MMRPPPQSPLPPPEPLDEAERALARALRNLPAGSPPPELDALILGASRRAVHIQPPRRRDRRWVIGLSTAATAVLAMGILLKMHGLGRDAVLAPPAETESTTTLGKAPANAPESPAAASDAMQKNGEQDKKQAAKDEAPMATDAAAPAGAEAGVAAATRAQPQQEESGRLRERQSASSGTLAAKQAPRAFPAEVVPRALPPPPPPVVLETPAPMTAQAPAPASLSPSVADERKESDAAASGFARRDAAALSAPAPAAAGGMLGPNAQDRAKASKPASNAMQANEPTPQRQELDKVEIVGSRLKAASNTLPSLSDDAKLTSAEWIERIRERLRAGDRASAVSSLHRLVHAYPDLAIPDDLQPLLH